MLRLYKPFISIKWMQSCVMVMTKCAYKHINIKLCYQNASIQFLSGGGVVCCTGTVVF